ncbi:MAG: hypothetical protein QGI86_24150 [Candidatus Poribacteria bacterium]|jgi:hypothetical protein|nr:hypothetical protein [Candidatus Poribacteria bacterium]MDP6751221.1 hypothetical protein [Candidatus Poribacteria bacterium]MDP6998946.1 hypothetical protein [Candidatus Poribacteria bacterium]
MEFGILQASLGDSTTRSFSSRGEESTLLVDSHLNFSTDALGIGHAVG